MQKTHINRILNNEIVLGLSIILIFASFGYDGYEYKIMRDQNIYLQADLNQFEKALTVTQTNLLKSRNEALAIEGELQTERGNNSLFQNQIQTISSTVGVLEKLSKTDPELLKKYSKIYFLNENYVPPSLTNIEEKYLYLKDKPLQIHTNVWPHLKSLMDSAESQNVIIEVISAYRSFGTQTILKSDYKVTYGAGTANKFSADQGYSEHQLGTTVDFTTPSVGVSFIGLKKTDAYNWLVANAYKYGFILSYPKNNSYYVFEPWHFRFVGIALATRLHNGDLNFYDLDQRDIDQYLANFLTKTKPYKG